MINILNYGGGVNSTALIIEMKNRNIRPDYVIFSNTGEEMPETYIYLDIMRNWFIDNGFKFIEVGSRHGKLYDYYSSRKTIPFRKFRDCTDKFKKVPINNFIKQFKKDGITQFIGISYDELQRMRTSDKKWITLKFPLVDWKIDRNECIEIIKKEGLPVPVKSGCYMCPFQSDLSWKNLYKTNKDLWKKAREIEENNRTYPKNTLRWSGTLKELEYAIKTQTKLSGFSDEICGGFCFT
jgi:3'-phosphoadenosine 5'-phosphosulfate sulfotransferase (PAPS reductase)/FAD synthetase